LTTSEFDLIVVGSGIVGLAHALEGAKRGLRVCVIDRDARPVGASIRNFGFITVTGQAAGETYRRAQFSRDVWEQIAPEAGIEIVQRGLWLLAKRPEAMAVLEAFMETDMRAGCELLTAKETSARAPVLLSANASGALFSSHELRVESREAIPKLVAWLEARWSVTFRWCETVTAIAAPDVTTSMISLRAERVVYCPGTLLHGPFASRIATYGLRLCRLQMQRIRPTKPIKLSGSVMSDLSLVRYEGYCRLPAAAALLERLEREESQSLADGIHLIVVQSADGSLIVGDSHHYDPTPDPFASNAVDLDILRHVNDTIDIGEHETIERWIGVYPSSIDRTAIIDAPDNSTRMVIVSSGTGASTAFGLAQDVFSTW